VFRLPPHRLLPPDAEPVEVLINRGLESGLQRVASIILDGEAKIARRSGTRDRNSATPNKSVAEMQMAVRLGAKRKTGGGIEFSTLVITGHRSLALPADDANLSALPAIHPLGVCYDMRWMHGSSPRLTTE